VKILLRIAAAFLTFQALATWADDGLPSQKEYEPKGGKGRVVVLVSGQTGPSNYTELAKGIADDGYYVVLVDGNDFWIKGGGGESLLQGVIKRAQESPHALAGKVGVIGCSLGGASVLTYAVRMPDIVGAVVAQYPLTSFIADPAGFVGKIQVPTLLLAGTFDTYKGCCLIAKARELDNAANSGPGPRLLEVYEYPGVDHGFSTDTSKRRDIMSDSLHRTIAHLHRYLTDS
jgi:dienelactone hydrolase